MSDAKQNRQILVCNCRKTMDIDGAGLAEALSEGRALPVCTELCRSEKDTFVEAISKGGLVHVACTQEAPLFREIAEASAADGTQIHFTNIRETAGWSGDRKSAQPKIAALLAAAMHEGTPTGLKTLTSNGTCLVYGRGQVALDAAAKLSETLSVTLLLEKIDDAVAPRVANFAIFAGCIANAHGYLGAFDITVDGYAAMLPSSRATLDFAAAQNGAKSQCDLILDLSGNPPLLTGHDRRDGYISVDPDSPVAVADALRTLSTLVGEFEKPLYVSYDADICAHSRNSKIGCTNCLDNCPIGAIRPAGDNVVIDHGVCAGCGTCSAVCPTGAVTSAYPRREDILARVDILLATFRGAGGAHPIVLLHDETHGADLIDALARYGDGLPSNVLPVQLNSVLQTGHEILIGTLVAGAEHVVCLLSPKHAEEHAPIEAEATLANTITKALGIPERCVSAISENDPDALSEFFAGLSQRTALNPQILAASGNKRQIARTLLAKLHAAAPEPQDIIILPDDAPYGRIKIDAERCTLCLACVGTCPANALSDNPDQPQVAFTEAACVQCGLCRVTCPENAISLEPRYNFTTAALSPDILHTEEPFCCIRCGTAFGAKSSIERVMDELKDHPMFQADGKLDLIQMCDRCRVETLAEGKDDPFTKGARPAVRTTEDYLAEEEAEKIQTKSKPEDFLT